MWLLIKTIKSNLLFVVFVFYIFNLCYTLVCMEKTIKNDESILIEIKKSKFIGLSFFCENIEMANEYVKVIRSKHKKATHVCFAYIVNSNEKASDDGEPQGTAGIPILDVLKKQKLKNVLVVVVRYFGGIKLGAGGLVRAYSETASSVVEKSEQADLIAVKEVKTILNYGDEYLLNILKTNKNVYDINVNYTDKMEVTFCITPECNLTNFELIDCGQKLIRI